MTNLNSTATPIPAAPVQRGRRRLRVLGFVAGVCVTLAILLGGYHWLTRPQRVAALVEAILQKNLGGQARVAHARFQIRGPIEIQGIQLQLPGELHGHSRLLEIDRVILQHRPLSLMWGRLTVTRVQVDQPRIYLTEFLPQQEFNWERLFSGRFMPSEDFKFKGDLPQVQIREGLWIMGRVDATGYRELGRFEYTGQMHAHANAPGLYDFHLTQQYPETQTSESALLPPALKLHGRFDLSKPMLMAELMHLDCTRVNPTWLPTLAEKWWNQLQPQGSLPIVQIGLNPQDGPWAKVIAKQVALTMPLPHGNIALAAHEVVATFRNNTLHLEKFTGTLESCDFSMQGYVRDMGENATLKLDVDLQGPVPHQPHVLAILPPVTRSYLKRFSVRGRFHTQMTLQRQKPGEDIESLGTLDLDEGSLSDSRNPYPMENVRARIRYDHDAVVIERIDAVGKSGAVIHAQGAIRPATNAGALDFVITMKDAPLDEHLLGALEGEERQIVEQLISPQALETLRSVGVIGDHQPFALDGTVDLKIEIHAPAGSTDTLGHVTTTIDLTGGKMLCDFWPYPLIARSGQLQVKGKKITVQNVHLQGLTGATATLTGELRPHETHPQRTVTDLRVTAHGVPLDTLLRASLPNQEAELLEQLGLSGTFDGKGHIFTSPQNDLTFTIEPTLTNCVVQPLGSSFTLTDLQAKLILQPHLAILESLRANHGTGTLMLTGRMLRTKDQRQLELTAEARDFPLEQGLLSLPVLQNMMDEKTWAQLRTYDPQGVVDATLDFRSGSGQQSPKPTSDAPDSASPNMLAGLNLAFAIKLKPQSLNVLVPTRGDQNLRVPMQDFMGSVEIEPGRMQFQNLRATVDGALLGVQGAVEWSEGTLDPAPTTPSKLRMDLRWDAQADRLGPGLRGLLPSGLHRALEQMSFQGGFSMSDGRLQMTPDVNGSRLRWDSTVVLRQASAFLGVAISELDGTLIVSVQQPSPGGPMLLDLRAQAERVRVVDRLVSPLSFQLLTTPQALREHESQAGNMLVLDRLELRDLKGLCYGGKVVGSGTMIAGEPGGYSLRLVLDDAALDPIVNPRKNPTLAIGDTAGTVPQDPANKPTGRLSANLTLEGVSNDVRTRRGRGELMIREARLYEVPIAMTLLQIMHLTWPSSHAFDRATARYVIAGETVHVEDLRFEAPDLLIVGEGTVQFPGLHLALNMYTRHPRRTGWGALGEAIDLIRDGVLSIRVTGTLDQPQAKLQGFTGIRRTWDELFKPGKP